jgi:hypothetical protein
MDNGSCGSDMSSWAPRRGDLVRRRVRFAAAIDCGGRRRTRRRCPLLSLGFGVSNPRFWDSAAASSPRGKAQASSGRSVRVRRSWITTSRPACRTTGRRWYCGRDIVPVVARVFSLFSFAARDTAGAPTIPASRGSCSPEFDARIPKPASPCELATALVSAPRNPPRAPDRAAEPEADSTRFVRVPSGLTCK